MFARRPNRADERLAREIAASAQELAGTSEALAQLVAEFKLEKTPAGV